MTASLVISENTLRVSGELDFASVLPLAKQGEKWLMVDAPAQGVIDLSAVTYSNSAGIALLLGWLRIAAQQKKSLAIRHLPKDMAVLAKVGGLEDVLGNVENAPVPEPA